MDYYSRKPRAKEGFWVNSHIKKEEREKANKALDYFVDKLKGVGSEQEALEMTKCQYDIPIKMEYKKNESFCKTTVELWIG